MRYNPNVSVVENAKSNNCSEAAVRKYIKVHCIALIDATNRKLG